MTFFASVLARVPSTIETAAHALSAWIVPKGRAIQQKQSRGRLYSSGRNAGASPEAKGQTESALAGTLNETSSFCLPATIFDVMLIMHAL
ncbi:hypothetical protein MRB53_020655 [Persea americana]|uniref:Uncharacterized protein n=1 Tax=Persea americana TaxID=3435 RepID=A0ACC2L1V5_PERAE|nr:hypothetical protein MRB53_020655 [Persea americana]